MATQLWYVNVFSGNFTAAVSFYRDMMGMSLRFIEKDHGYAAFDSGQVGFSVARVDKNADNYKQLVGRFTGIGLSVDDLDAEYDRLKSLGVEFSSPPQQQPWGGYMAIVKDPDGNELYLDQYRAH